MAFQIRPLGSTSGAAPAVNGAFQIRPLDHVLLDVANLFGDGGGLSAEALTHPPGDPRGTAISGGDGSGGAGPGVSPTNAEIAMEFGHLAGPSPLMAAFPSLSLTPDDSTPAGFLSGVFGAIPAPGLISSLIGPTARGMQQSAFNTAVASPQGSKAMLNIQNEFPVDASPPGPDPTTFGYSGLSGTNATYSGQYSGTPNGFTVATTGAGPNPSLGLFSGRGVDDTAPTSATTGETGVPDAPGVAAANSGNDGGGGGGGGGGSHLCTWAARLLGKEKATGPLRDSFVQEFARKYPGTWKQDFKDYQKGAKPLIEALNALPPEEQRHVAERVYREVLKPFAPTVEPDEVDDVVRALERVGFALAKEQGVEIPKELLEFSKGARRTRMLSGKTPAPKRRPLLKAMGAEA